MLLGSGTVPVVVVPVLPVVVVVAEQLSIKLSCKVTAPLSAMILPHSSVAPVFRESLATAIMVPSNAVVVPRVAELPTFQKILSFCPALIPTTMDALAVVSVLPIWKTTRCLLRPHQLIMSSPVNCAEEL